MTDSSQETTNGNMEVECGSPEEQSSPTVIQNVMEQVQQMAEQNKFTVLHKVAELSIEHLNKRKEIMKQQRSIKKVLEQRMQTKSDLFLQHNFQKNVQQIEDLKHTTSLRVREKLESINALIKSNEALRAQLKEDDAMARSEMDEIKKQLDALSGKVNFLQYAYKKGENRLKDLGQQVQNASVENDKLQQDCHAKEREMGSTLSKQTEMMQKLKNGIMENKAKIQQRVEELQREQQKLHEQTAAFDQLQTEKETIHKNYLQLMQTNETELAKKQEHFTKQIEFSQKSFDDMKMEKEKLIEDMTNSVKNLNGDSKAMEDRIKELNDKRLQLANDLQNSKERNGKLKQQIDNHNRNKQQNLELAKLKESVKAVKIEAKEAVNKPIKLWNIRPKRNVFVKGVENRHVEQGAPPKNPPICVISDSDQSDAFETSAYFDGKV